MYNELISNHQIKFHTSSIDSLYAFVPREMLPEEYGGSAGSLATLRSQTQQLLAEKRQVETIRGRHFDAVE